MIMYPWMSVLFFVLRSGTIPKIILVLVPLIHDYLAVFSFVFEYHRLL